MRNCQVCCNHKNNPSRCIDADEGGPVGRKDSACRFFCLSDAKHDRMERESFLQFRLAKERKADAERK